MSNSSIERYIEMEARERNMLRYESMLWGLLSAGAAIGAGALLMSGWAITPILLGVVALAAYIKRDEVAEEYNLKASSGAGRVSAKQWAKELGHTKLVDGTVAEKANIKTAMEAPTQIDSEQTPATQTPEITETNATQPQKNWEQSVQHETTQKEKAPTASLRQ